MSGKKIISVISAIILISGSIALSGCGKDDSDSGNGNNDQIQKPSGLTAVSDGTGSIQLKWLDNSDNETGFVIERRLEGETFAETRSLSENTEAFDVSGLDASTIYYFRVRAFNDQSYSDYTDEISERTNSSEGNDGSGYLSGDVMAPWEGGPDYYSNWSNGPSDDPNIFPVAVWLQTPSNVAAYKAIGVNYYIGLWEGPTEDHLSSLTDSAMSVMCDQNYVGLNSENNGIIKSWLQQDEPDNAQGGTQDPLSTDEVISRYDDMVAQDSTRPVFLNLGQGVAADAWYGRGNRTNHPEDYAQYALGADILSFDIYPMNIHPRPESDPQWFTDFDNVVTQKIWYVATGVDRLRGWTDYKKPVWAWIESTNISSDENYELTPVHVKAEVWMAIIHGARGIGYFTHEFTVDGDYVTDSGLLRDTEMKAAVGAVNARIASLASVLNTQSVANGLTTVSDNSDIPVDTMVKRSGGFTYVFAVAMRPGTTAATFTLREFTGDQTVEVVGESRTISSNEGVFQDDFGNYEVHIYRIPNP